MNTLKLPRFQAKIANDDFSVTKEYYDFFLSLQSSNAGDSTTGTQSSNPAINFSGVPYYSIDINNKVSATKLTVSGTLILDERSGQATLYDDGYPSVFGHMRL